MLPRQNMITNISVSLPLGNRGSLKGSNGGAGEGVSKVGTKLKETNRVGCSIPELETEASDSQCQPQWPDEGRSRRHTPQPPHGLLLLPHWLNPTGNQKPWNPAM